MKFVNCENCQSEIIEADQESLIFHLQPHTVIKITPKNNKPLAVICQFCQTSNLVDLRQQGTQIINIERRAEMA